ncbi:hypothetical protein OAH36_00920 [Verrucomicrobia bacterium]|jgi:hypothetical protein|nr:hypothetical protein [Verrucomicrobiota bacterium]MDA7510706.1 hypothetical protein [Verrucomicrobiota bacterium]MDB4798139.1 hypothetical protein [Verrucomicrobiota bacterium]
MKLNNDEPAKTDAKTDLVAGQLWQVGEFHIEIVQLGKTLCHYRHLRNLNQKGIPVRLEQRKAVEKYLKEHKALLVGNRKDKAKDKAKAKAKAK